MARRLRMFVILAEDPGLSSSSHMVARRCAGGRHLRYFQASATHVVQTYMQAKHLYLKKKEERKKKLTGGSDTLL